MLEPVSMSALDDLHEYSIQPELYRYLEFDSFTSVDETQDYLKKLIARSKLDLSQYWFIRLLDEDKVVGSIGAHSLDVARGSIEVGYGVSPAYWGRGIFTAAAKILMDYIFNDLKLHRIVARTAVENVGSIKSLEKLKFKSEGIMRDYYKFSDASWHDAVLMSRLSTD